MPAMQTLTLGILFSGTGSNMQNLIEKLHQKVFLQQNTPLKLEVVLEVVLCATNNPRAGGIDHCQKLNMPFIVGTEDDFIPAFRGCALLLCAGYNKILSPVFLAHYKALNIHPSLLPKHKGARALERSFNSQSALGVSVHWVSDELDSGDLILQERLSLNPQESLESYEKRLHALEHRLYPQAVLKALKLRPYA
ncbi:formyltransferase family protein [Helicobacter heilmannii]|uniref:phosphoribosylglycinamide formyltransferase 1 n=3 Tax=Helicobacter heilmannii TaxID=35817 RepID=A0A0K2YA89_HELHE|nr:phosphoribosylglycinamide formyltransferase [Helicobacter heilmannii]CCM11746.1 Phosphoribosylglycinamide formyltransferase [Helicobacter heilmannii ASB1.4]CCM73271.1 Phosphoribosylglycinamide formyltransferase [Helicobacter heilmannii ASB1.4]CRI33885.1 Phosphoribosylglycinamide formyltransferase [Helicobacter heilmannii]